MENGFIPHQVPASKPRAIRASVIISNPAHRPQVTQASPNILPTTVEAPISESKSRSWDNLASMNDDAADEGADSDGSGIILLKREFRYFSTFHNSMFRANHCRWWPVRWYTTGCAVGGAKTVCHYQRSYIVSSSPLFPC